METEQAIRIGRHWERQKTKRYIKKLVAMLKDLMMRRLPLPASLCKKLSMYDLERDRFLVMGEPANQWTVGFEAIQAGVGAPYAGPLPPR
jgi:hypothetical protein